MNKEEVFEKLSKEGREYRKKADVISFLITQVKNAKTNGEAEAYLKSDYYTSL